MTIHKKNDGFPVKFRMLDTGDTFEYLNMLFKKTQTFIQYESPHTLVNAIDIVNGRGEYIDAEEEVRYFECETLTIWTRGIETQT